ncbi:choice-of-anchor A family protein [Arthrobacter sp. ISL-48]|uniref:collagen-binding domain-containing protein n=1 Tax=Arthrobacter sp. ISL-48 TaxID=2819110 RepID=UPI001BE8B092|nr:collagen-binding domain-containing protein [Arthrobacter sp. ISL-48]MBT2531240.1 choice-of-anchor A family protein [Arthrobacter sp. ISL-48]
MSPAVAGPATTPINPLAAYADWNVVSFGDVTINAESEGPVAVGGNLSFSGTNVAFKTSTAVALLVGGKVDLSQSTGALQVLSQGAIKIRELAKSAQLRLYPARPAVSLPSARGATMILLAAASKSDRAAYAFIFRQLAHTARAMRDTDKATDDLRRVRGLSTAVPAATNVVEASATAQTLKVQPMSMETLRQQHPEASEEALKSRLLVERSRGGSPLPPVLTRSDAPQLQGAQSRTEETHRQNNPGIQR